MMNAGKVQNGRVSTTNKKIACSNKKKSSSITDLPEDVIFSIFFRLPPDILYNSVRYVCHMLNKIIRDPRFTKEHLLHCTSGMFIQGRLRPYTAYFAELGKMNAMMTNVNFPFDTPVLATCDGLVLFRDAENNTIHVANPLTRQRVTVSLFSPGCGGFVFLLARARSSGEYKVVCRYCFDRCKFQDFMIFTLGKDHPWKLIDSVRKLSDIHRDMIWIEPFSAGGFVYWAHCDYPFVLALDVESEKFYDHPCPVVYNIEKNTVYFVPREESISCVVHFRSHMRWDVWVLSNPMSGGWKKIFKIDLSVGKPWSYSKWYLPDEMAWFTPVAWLNNGEVVIFGVHHAQRHFAHNVKTGETVAFALDSGLCTPHSRFAYVYSLVSVTPS